MRRKIREFAANRNLCDEEIKGAMTCEHEEIAKLFEKHSINLAWLYAPQSAAAGDTRPRSDKEILNRSEMALDLAAQAATKKASDGGPVDVYTPAGFYCG
jgi:hypothetical protein